VSKFISKIRNNFQHIKKQQQNFLLFLLGKTSGFIISTNLSPWIS